jgi:hypothetical protein
MNDEDRIHQELTRVANSRPKSGRGLQAKITALRTLEQMRRAEGADYGGVDPALVARLFDDRDDDERVSPDDWYPESGDPEGDATMRELDATSTLGQRRRLFLNFERGGRAMSRPSILNDRGERESLPIVVGGGRVLGVMVDVGEQSPRAASKVRRVTQICFQNGEVNYKNQSAASSRVQGLAAARHPCRSWMPGPG